MRIACAPRGFSYDAIPIAAKETMMNDHDAKPQDDAPTPDPVEDDGAGGDQESGAGYGNNAGYQGESPDPDKPQGGEGAD
jgi:hypothetical protein